MGLSENAFAEVTKQMLWVCACFQWSFGSNGHLPCALPRFVFKKRKNRRVYHSKCITQTAALHVYMCNQREIVSSTFLPLSFEVSSLAECYCSIQFLCPTSIPSDKYKLTLTFFVSHGQLLSLSMVDCRRDWFSRLRCCQKDDFFLKAFDSLLYVS